VTHPDDDARRLSPWDGRSPAVAAMLNPALIAMILAIAAREYSGRRDDALPAPYAFLIAPLVLHRDTRNELPRSVASHWANWASDNPVLIAGFPSRAIALREHVREGFRFGLRHGVLILDDAAGLVALQQKTIIPTTTSAGDIRDLVIAAQRVGRWLTKLELPATAFALLGVRP
jgi:hypothetical protein